MSSVVSRGLSLAIKPQRDYRIEVTKQLNYHINDGLFAVGGHGHGGTGDVQDAGGDLLMDGVIVDNEDRDVAEQAIIALGCLDYWGVGYSWFGRVLGCPGGSGISD